MTPPGRTSTPGPGSFHPQRPDPTNIESINILANNQTQQITKLIAAVQDISPQLFGRESFKLDSRGN